MGFYRGPNIVTDGLKFAMDAGSGRSYPGSGVPVNNIINGVAGRLENGVAYVTSNGGAFDFDGTDDFIKFDDDTALNSQAITMETWFNLDTTVDQSAFLFEKGQVNTQYSNFFDIGGSFYFRTLGLSSNDLTVDASLYVTVGVWCHCVTTVVGGVKKIYFDGVNVATVGPLTGTIPTNTTGLFIGAFGPGSGYRINGKIAVSRVYTKALTAAEVLQNYNAQKSRFA